jgi:superfamily II DNA or RNA helicase
MKRSVDQSAHSKTHKELDQLIFNNIDKIKVEYLKYIYNKNNKLRKKINLNREDKINIVEESNIEIEINDNVESLEKSAKSDILFASYQLVSEGTDIPTLNTLIMTTPKKQIEQVVGRILRAKTNFTPLILDIIDSSFSVYQNQSYYRNRYYRKCNYSIENIDIDAKDKRIPMIDEEIIIERIEKPIEQICDDFIKCLI